MSLQYNGTNLSYNGNLILGLSSGSGTTTPPVTSGATLLFADEFTGSSVSFATDTGGGNWRTRGIEGGASLASPPSVTTGYIDYAGQNWNISPIQHPSNSPFSVANSILTITARRNPGLTNVGGASWISGLLVSNYLNGLTWKYGYFEWRMRLPITARGMFPALWMFNNDQNIPSGYTGAELDMLEVFGHATGSPTSNGWHETPSGINNGGPGEQAFYDVTQWHRYSIEWTSSDIKWYLDGTLFYSAGQSVATWFQNANLGVRINYAMDPTFMTSNEVSTSTDPAVGTEPYMEVDYIRVYDKAPSVMVTGSNDPGIQS